STKRRVTIERLADDRADSAQAVPEYKTLLCIQPVVWRLGLAGRESRAVFVRDGLRREMADRGAASRRRGLELRSRARRGERTVAELGAVPMGQRRPAAPGRL